MYFMKKTFQILIPLVTTLLALLSFKSFTESEVTNKPFVVVLDAGHGGHDSGNRGSGYFEKDIALDIILKTGAILEKNPDIKVIYTRKTDVFVELNQRGDIANKAKADLFVSVHCNAHHSNVSGTETFVLGLHANERNFNIAKKENSVILLEDNYETNYDGFDPNSPESVIGLTITQEQYLEQSLDLASHIQKNFSTQLKRGNRGVKQAGFIVLHRTFMPSVLIETGFLTNKAEGRYLNSKKGKLEMASAIAKAVVNYKKSVVSSFELNEADIPITDNSKDIIPSKKGIVTDKPEIKNTTAEQPTTKAITKTPQNGVEFKIQIAAGSKELQPTPANFKGLSGVEVKKTPVVYKYYYGSEDTYEAIKKIKQNVIEKGFKSCFIVAFKDGKSIPLSQAVGL